MLKGQTLDVWLDKMAETSKGYENEITEISRENLDWAKTWVKQSKRSLENYLETSAKKRSKANNGKRVAPEKKPLGEKSTNVSLGPQQQKRKSDENAPESEAKRRKSSEVDQIMDIQNVSGEFDAKGVTKKVQSLKVTELREELKKLGCSGKELRGRKVQLVRRLVKMMKEEFEQQKEFLDFPQEVRKQQLMEEKEDKNVEENSAQAPAGTSDGSFNSGALQTITEKEELDEVEEEKQKIEDEKQRENEEKRREEETNKRHSAATTIAALFRAYISRKVTRTLLLDKQRMHAALRLQSLVRKRLATKRVQEMRLKAQEEKDRLLQEQLEREKRAKAAAEAEAIALEKKRKKEEEEIAARLKKEAEEAENLRLAKLAEKERLDEEERIKAAEELLKSLATDDDENDSNDEGEKVADMVIGEDEHDEVNETGASEEDITEFLKSNGISMDGTESNINTSVASEATSHDEKNDSVESSGKKSSTQRLENIRNKLNKIKTQEVSTPVLLGRHGESNKKELGKPTNASSVATSTKASDSVHKKNKVVEDKNLNNKKKGNEEVMNEAQRMRLKIRERAKARREAQAKLDKVDGKAPAVSSGAGGGVAAAVKAKGGARLVKGPLTNHKEVPVIKPSKSNVGKIKAMESSKKSKIEQTKNDEKKKIDSATQIRQKREEEARKLREDMEKKLKATAAAKQKIQPSSNSSIDAKSKGKEAQEKKGDDAPSKSYRMSDPHSSDDSSDSESDSEDDNGRPKKKKKPPAPWARGSPLKKALKMQFGVKGNAPMNPDEIFADMTTCDLEKVFDMKKKRYQRRGSSGYWQTDRVTDAEKQAYAKRMGFAPALLHKTL